MLAVYPVILTNTYRLLCSSVLLCLAFRWVEQWFHIDRRWFVGFALLGPVAHFVESFALSHYLWYLHKKKMVQKVDNKLSERAPAGTVNRKENAKNHSLVWTNWQICPCICAVAKADCIGAVATIWPAALIIWALCSCPLVIIICCGWCVVVVATSCCVVGCCVCGCCCCIVTLACWTWLWMSFCKLWRVIWISCRVPVSLITWCCCCVEWISIWDNGSSTTTVMPLI